MSMIVCMKCGKHVKGPVTNQVTGMMVHAGHVDPALDKTCGMWAWIEQDKLTRKETKP